MNKGENLCYFRKKEQCIMVGKQLREMKIENYKVYRLKKDGTVVFMHPADGVFPEKVNKGRVQVNGRPFSIGQNPVQSELRFTKYHKKAYEADPLTTMFVKARIAAFEDVENLFALPQPNMDETLIPEEEREKYTEQEYTTKMMEALKRVQEYTMTPSLLAALNCCVKVGKILAQTSRCIHALTKPAMPISSRANGP